MFVEILSMEKTLYSGEVYGVVLPGVDGEFTILDHHINMIAALKSGEVKILEKKDNHGKVTLRIISGFLDMNNNKADIFVEYISVV